MKIGAITVLGSMLLLTACVARYPGDARQAKVICSPVLDLPPEVLMSAEKLADVLAELERNPADDTLDYRYDLYACRLYVIFQKLYNALPPTDRAAALSEQEEWNTQQQTALRLGRRSAESLKASIDATKTRILEIEKRIAELPAHDGPAVRAGTSGDGGTFRHARDGL